jgi:hypothetical protein
MVPIMLSTILNLLPRRGHKGYRKAAAAHRTNRLTRLVLEGLEERLALSDVSGEWAGSLTQVGSSYHFNYFMHLTQNDQGMVTAPSSSRIEITGQTQYYGVMDLVGTVTGNQFNFHETRITENHPLPPYSWLLKSGTLTVSDDGQSMMGQWSSGGAHGTINLTLVTVTPTSLQWDTMQGGADYSYQVGGATLPIATTVALYWSRSDQFADHIGGPIQGTSRPIPAGTAVGTYGPYNVPESLLQNEPDGATNLVLVTDPNNVLGNFSEGTNVRALTLGDIVTDSVRTTDAKNVIVDYDINTTITQPFVMEIFRSRTRNFNPLENSSLGFEEISGSDEAIGHHIITVQLDPGQLWPGFSPLKYVLAVADPDHVLNGVTIDNSRAHYRDYIIAAVSVGFDARSLFTSDPPDWVVAMASSLEAAGYDRAIPFSWDSASPEPGLAEAAGFALVKQLESEINQAAQGLDPNDVIDLHLIGHSRGTVVVSQALQHLGEFLPEQVQHGYWKMTLLDPHPANNMYGRNGSFAGPDKALIPFYLAFQGIVNDPPVVVPARVNLAEILWQKTPCSGFPATWFESGLNLKGLSPRDITIEDPNHTIVMFQDLTGVSWGDGRIGHMEVHDYYQANFIPNLGVWSPTGANSRTRAFHEEPVLVDSMPEKANLVSAEGGVGLECIAAQDMKYIQCSFVPFLQGVASNPSPTATLPAPPLIIVQGNNSAQADLIGDPLAEAEIGWLSTVQELAPGLVATMNRKYG